MSTGAQKVHAISFRLGKFREWDWKLNRKMEKKDVQILNP